MPSAPGPRAVVTGAGAVTPLGESLAATRDGLSAGRSALADATLLDPSGSPGRAAGEVLSLDARRYFRVPKALKLTDRKTRFAVAAAAMAFSDSGSSRAGAADDGLGVLLATTGSDFGAADLSRALSRDPDGRVVSDIPTFADRVLGRLNPLWLLVNLPNMTSAHVAIQLEACGPNSTLLTGASGGLQAIAEAGRWIGRGHARAVVAGGTDAPVHPWAWAAFEQAGFLGPDPSPFVPGEGAAVCLVEEETAARARGARIRGTLLGSGSAAGRPGEAGGLLRAARGALAASGIDPARIGALSLSVAGPEPEGIRDGLARLLGPLARPAWTPPATVRTGHLLAASSALEAVLALDGTPGPALVASLGYSGDAAALVLLAGDQEGTP